MNYKELRNNDKYEYDHTSYFRGYVSRKDTDYKVEEYKGKFGKGYKVYRPNWKSTTYSYVDYWIEK